MRALAVLATLALACDAYRVLVVFPIPTTSHVNLGHGFVTHLLRAGHQVTYITPAPVKDPSKNLRQIDVSSNFDLFPTGDILNLTKLMNKEVPAFDTAAVLQLIIGVADGTLMNERVQSLLHNVKEEFDVVIAEWMFTESYSGLAPVFGCPLIWSSSMEPHAMVLTLMDVDPNPAYVADYSSTMAPPFDFRQRVLGLWKLFSAKYYKWLSSPQEASIYEKAFSSAAAARGRQLPSFDTAIYNGSLMFGNSHVSAGIAYSLPQSYIPIAGYHIGETVKPLPKDLQTLMDNAKHGVIYFSMGSVLSSKSLSAELQRALLATFGRLQQTVLWKLEEAPGNLPENVHLIGFAPQQSILNHPNCVLFITHGGLLSNTEALHFGVPIIGIPVFADQFLNIDRAVSKGYAKRVDFDHNFPEKLGEAIADILGNTRYRDRVKELSFVYHHRQSPPGQTLVHWVEHVVRTRGAPHLRSPALLVPWYLKMYLDLLSLVFVVVLLSIFVVRRLMPTKIDVKKKNR
ncbi:UDP-glucosyltransferase 2-like [Leguminivora glycinivorella]|uniref:UDP-glucosyltransferase 2-like n=1 Tax=Leguminivora glycinivorella TaxID=1035111 RepID=UPI0020101A81|nr:UDP-glucosyltransferase 2-like [Leguminivora glycinivorella]XP_048004498.1 UDP-glucosyltransferase 2-like [Leguminivora glycinivorella]